MRKSIQRKQHQRQRQRQHQRRESQNLQDAAKEFKTYRNDVVEVDDSNQDNNNSSIEELDVVVTPQAKKEIEGGEDSSVSSLSSAASSDSASSSSVKSRTSIDSFIHRQQQAQRALESAKNYLYDHHRDNDLISLVASAKARQHYNHYDEDHIRSNISSSEEDDSIIITINPQWYHKKSILQRIIFVLSLVAIWSTYIVVTTMYKACQQD